MNADLVISNIGQLVTCSSNGRPKRGTELRDAGLIKDGAIAIADGRIAAVGRSGEILRDYSAEINIDAHGRAVCPGFVDPHTHIVYAGDRLSEFEQKISGEDYLEILKAGGGILSTVKSTREATRQSLVEAGLKRLDTMLTCGTTTAEIKTGYGLSTDAELKMLRVIEELDESHAMDIVPTFLAAHAIPPEFNENPDGYVELICEEMLPRAWDWYERSHFFGKLPFFIDVFCERNAFDLIQSKTILETARQMGYRLKAHVDEFSNLGGSRMCIAMQSVSIDHLDCISDDEVKMLAASDTIGVVTPTVNFNLGSTKFADARKLIDEGCAIALSTDRNPGSAPCPSQPMAMAIACRYQKLLPAEAINAATINAAFAIGLGGEIGSIERGKKADLLVLDAEDYRETVYEFGYPAVGKVIKSGSVVRS